MSQSITSTINLTDVFMVARQETLDMIETGIDISDPSIVTPLEATANQYPEIALTCNDSLMELVRWQMNLVSDQQSDKITNNF